MPMPELLEKAPTAADEDSSLVDFGGVAMKELDPASKATSVGGGAILGGMITGIGAFVLASTSSAAGHFEAAGIAFLAAAVAFVGVANAIFRH